jgi:hypothetical protein
MNNSISHLWAVLELAGYTNHALSADTLPALGSQDFVDKMQSLIKVESNKLKEIPKAQHRPLGKPLDYYVEAFPNSKEDI